MTVKTGLDRLREGDAEALRLLDGKRLGLLAHPASVDAHLVHAREVLRGRGLDVRVIFGPEHGYGGEAQDMIGVAGAHEPGTGIPIHSLYGATEEALRPRAEWLRGLDVVVIDLQDIGSRYYTYVWTAALMFLEAARLGVRTVVLDRPNPLGGVRVEGGPQRPGHRSFVGLYDVSVRHGLTLGEVVEMVRDLHGLPAEGLAVVRCSGWDPAADFDRTGLPWVLPSPNMPTLDTAFVYPGGCLLEGTNLSEGRGTTRPFEIFGAPFVDGKRLAAEVRLEGALLRPLTFEPTFHKHGRTLCGGVEVHVTDRARFRPYEAYLRMLAALWAHGEGPAWRTDTYEFVSDRPAIDLLTGGPEFRLTVDAGAAVEDVIADERRGAQVFAEDRRAWLLYPRPK